MFITASAFNKSIELALRNPPDVEASITRIKHILNRLPEGTIYTSNHGTEVSFYTLINNHQKYLSKRSEALNTLARRKYLQTLLKILELTQSTKAKDIKQRQKMIDRLQNLIMAFERGNLDIAKIVLTSKQYKWYKGQFIRKHLDPKDAVTTSCGLNVRSKSERDIANANELLAVPFHYEEQALIYAHDFVMQLEEKLKRENKLRGPVYSFRGNGVHWNVPPELEWMNAPGSIWKGYYPPTGKITIYNDFKIMLADGEIIIWEHEGLMEDFVYRCNASERAAIIKYTETVSKGNLIETYERDVDTLEKRIDIIERHILPRLWF